MNAATSQKGGLFKLSECMKLMDAMLSPVEIYLTI